MAWLWSTVKQQKREIESIKRVGGPNSPIYRFTFKGRGPFGGKEVRDFNLIFEKDPMIKKAINNWAQEEYDRRLAFGMESVIKNRKLHPNRRFIMLNKETLETEFLTFDEFYEHVKRR